MKFNFVCKNFLGVVATLILIILLSQSYIFNFLIDTVFGRALLILIILGISYLNHIFGIISVLFIIIIFNHIYIGYFEGFKSIPNQNITENHKKDNLKKQKIKSQQSVTTSSSSIASLNAIKNNKVEGQEGFNIIEREGTMLRGKRSNEFPVLFNSRTQTDDVEPLDKSLFLNSYSNF